MKSTKPQVFIIESLRFEDEANDQFEGRRIADVLSLSGKLCHYVYVRTKVELEAVMDQFWDTRYRYLHLSCHADCEGMDTTLERVSFHDLGVILNPYLEKRRLFVSACEMSCPKFARKIIPGTDCYSLLGPSKKVDVADAAIFWAAFYHRIFRLNSESMNRTGILATASVLSSAFSIPLNFYWPRDGRLATRAILCSDLRE